MSDRNADLTRSRNKFFVEKLLPFALVIEIEFKFVVEQPLTEPLIVPFIVLSFVPIVDVDDDEEQLIGLAIARHC